jgi:hypothetical protein
LKRLDDQLTLPGVDVADILEKYYSQATDFRIKRQVISEGMGSEEEKKELRRFKSLPVQYALSFYDVLDNYRELHDGITGEEYHRLLHEWETAMINSGDPAKQSAVIALRMMEHQIDIPPRLLSILPRSVQIRNKAAQLLRKEHGLTGFTGSAIWTAGMESKGSVSSLNGQ